MSWNIKEVIHRGNSCSGHKIIKMRIAFLNL